MTTTPTNSEQALADTGTGRGRLAYAARHASDRDERRRAREVLKQHEQGIDRG